VEVTNTTDEIARRIARCVEVCEDLPVLRDELHELRLSSDPRAVFATSLFDLERARRGDAEARAMMIDIADSLLAFWREGSGDAVVRELPVLDSLWGQATALLVSFEVKRFKRALVTCWESRHDAALLSVAIGDLKPEGNRRVEFARCLYHLELARLFVDPSRVEFAKRAALLSDAYQNETVATELVGEDQGLSHLWTELLPYLDEFFEMMEESAARKNDVKTDPTAKTVSRGEVRTDPGLPGVSDITLPTALEGPRKVPSFRALLPNALTDTAEIPPEDQAAAAEAVPPGAWLDGISRESGFLEESPVLDAELEEVAPTPPPPPPPPSATLDLTPPGAWTKPAELDDDVVEVVEAEPEVVAPPPLPPKRRPAPSLDVVLNDGYAPDAVTLAFWRHTFQALDLLPDPKVQRASKRLLTADSRTDRKRLNDYLDTLWTHHAVPEAKAFGSLLRLLMAGQLKEKTLFGSPNSRRAEAFAQAFSLLSTDPLAAGHAASWFQLDGAETEAALQRGLEVLMQFLAWCVREGRDPLDAAAHQGFLKLD
jgi:hypothetical protein